MREHTHEHVHTHTHTGGRRDLVNADRYKRSNVNKTFSKYENTTQTRIFINILPRRAFFAANKCVCQTGSSGFMATIKTDINITQIILIYLANTPPYMANNITTLKIM